MKVLEGGEQLRGAKVLRNDLREGSVSIYTQAGGGAM